MQKFRIVEKNEEIIQLMDKAPENDKGETWQTLPGQRLHYQIAYLRNDTFNKAIVLESSTDYEFSLSHPVYVRINHRDLIFKLTAKSFMISGKKLACSYPEFAKAVEKREFERIPLPEHREATLILNPLGASVAEIKVRLADLSKKGLGIFISDMNRHYLERNKAFKITAINGIYLSSTHQVTVKYIERIGKGVMRSGLAMDNPFPDPLYDVICKTIFGANPGKK
jgi:hypothetical protein